MRNPDNYDLVYMTRAMAWERAKGELNAILHTYQNDEQEKCREMGEVIEWITKQVEEYGLC